jgi:hypothetical protein
LSRISQVSSLAVSIELGGIGLRPVTISDSRLIVRLRNGYASRRFLNTGATSNRDQELWLQVYFERKARGLEHYFIITHADRDVGAVRIYEIDVAMGSFKWGSWVIESGTPPIVAFVSAVLVYDFAFDVLQLKTALFEVVAENLNVIRFHQSFGAALRGGPNTHASFELKKATYVGLRSRFLARIGLGHLAAPSDAAS